ncbi:MAG: hypothetical protein GY928_17150 [Colwellia sp.]|nr:hypothetical protein [Colwellia sp.]
MLASRVGIAAKYGCALTAEDALSFSIDEWTIYADKLQERAKQTPAQVEREKDAEVDVGDYEPTVRSVGAKPSAGLEAEWLYAEKLSLELGPFVAFCEHSGFTSTETVLREAIRKLEGIFAGE